MKKCFEGIVIVCEGVSQIVMVRQQKSDIRLSAAQCLYKMLQIGNWEMEELTTLLQECITDRLYQVILSNPRKRQEPGVQTAGTESDITKIKIRPVMVKNSVVFQETDYIGTRVFHENYEGEQMIGRICHLLDAQFRQGEIEGMDWKVHILVSKKGKMTIKKQKNAGGQTDNLPDLSHNRAKKYLLEEGKAVPFLVDLGVQSRDGKILHAKYDKFKQINRFLEFIEDILPELPKDRTVHIIDFGCGKSYLTFAMYYYLTEVARIKVRITGLDLKKDVIEHCNRLKDQYGYSGLQFLQGDISTFSGADSVDMVVTLHACDTATDYALDKAVKWGATVILSVPCCQHELNKQISCQELEPVLQYGLIRERMSALLTDAVRANLLEEQGYQTQILEFIDMEHTPKNILIRAVKRKEGQKKETGIQSVMDFLQVEPILQKLLDK